MTQAQKQTTPSSTNSNPLLAGKIALVTGASRGIGAAVAKRYAQEGAHVILVARTSGALEEVDDEIKQQGGSSTIVPLNLKHGDKIDQLGGIIAERWGHLDILVGNAAALGRLSPLSHIPPKIFSEVMEVNVNANWRLIRSFDTLLRQSQAGKALFVTSGVIDMTPAYWGAYTASKAALEALVKTYAAELEQTNVKVNLINPGIVATEMRANAMPGEDPTTIPSPDSITDVFVEAACDNPEIQTGVTLSATPRSA
ncbi:MAG: SDR family NAD(P)-dependent oxidoreductase [Rickettsiales bacterium]|nr:SDR family NAD(P)-dependent oxidoreductase [Rickettsiales bacterium]